MTATQIPTIDQIMVTLDRVAQGLNETRQGIAELRLAQQESERKMEKSREDFDYRMGRLGNRIGDLVESLVAKGIVQVFQELGYSFTQFCPGVKFKKEELNVSGEIDLFLENGDVACLVEVKTKLSVDDVNTHLEKMAKYRVYADNRGDKRRFIGAVGGVVVDDSVRNFSLNRGFYVVQLSGDNVKVIPPEGKPKEW
jgi:hypothetical protein